MMRAISLFSGCGGIDLALERNGVEVVLQAEKDKQALSVLRHHWPKVKRIDDVRSLRSRRGLGRIDIVAGGFPCQDLSVAGRRAGIGGERSGLWWEFHRIIELFAPTWVLVENVFGLFSSWTPTSDAPGGVVRRGDRGRRMVLEETSDFDTVTRSLSDLGYGWAARGFDAQWFGVPQRRERVFVVGHSGARIDRAAEVLFERESLPWDSPPSREAGQRVAASLTAGVASGRGVSKPGRRREDDDNLAVVGPLCSHSKEHGHAMGTQQAAEAGQLVATYDVSPTLSASGRGTERAGESRGQDCVVAHAFDARQSDVLQYGDMVGPLDTDGHSMAVATNTSPIAPELSFALTAKGGRFDGESETFVPVAFAQNTRDEVRELGGNIVGALPSQPGMKQQTYLAFQYSQSGVREVDTHATLDSNNGSRRHNGIAGPFGVRRLMPIECERCQGMPDHFTRYGVTEDGEAVELSDSARYRLIGNSVAIPNVEWIARRIVTQESP